MTTRSTGYHPPSPVPGQRSPRRMLILVLVLAAVVIAGVIAAEHTSHGRSIVAGVHAFLLKYMGVFALIGMTTTVGLGVVSTDRIVMRPGHRVVSQAVHRGVALATLTALVAHILLEMAAHKVDIIDAFVPFHAHFRTLYTGLGTIAFDLVILIIVTGYLRGKFAGKAPWAWRAIHSVAYLMWPLSIVHGLLGGRTAHPYVDWSYGACVALVILALAVRFAATVRPEDEKISHSVSDRLSAPAEGVIPGSRVAMTAPLSPAMSQPIALPAGSSSRAGQASATQIMSEVPAAAPAGEPVSQPEMPSWREPVDVPQAGWMASAAWGGPDAGGPSTSPGWNAPSFDAQSFDAQSFDTSSFDAPPVAAAPGTAGPAGWGGSYDPSSSPYDASAYDAAASYDPPQAPGWAASPGLSGPPRNDWSVPPGSAFPAADRAVPAGPPPGGPLGGLPGTPRPAGPGPLSGVGMPGAGLPGAGLPRDWPGPQGAPGGAPGHRNVPLNGAGAAGAAGLAGQPPPQDWSAPRQRTTPGDWATPGETTTPRGWIAPSDWSDPGGWTTPEDNASPGDWSAPGEWTPPGEWMPTRGGAQ
jgi:hypothetical protein